MKNMTRIGKISSMLVAGGLLLSSGLTVLANDVTTATPQTTVQKFEKMKGMGGEPRGIKPDFQVQLKQLVEKGLISQAQADKWTAFQEEQKTARKAEKEEEKAARKAEMEKVKAMTAEERKAYFEANKKDKKDEQDKKQPLSDVVSAGILTQEQADKILEAMKQAKEEAHKKAFQDHMTKLVEKGLISQAQADKWTAFKEAQQAARQAEMEKVKAMTEEEKKAYFGANKKERKDPLSDLVSAGIISQEQADKIKAEMPQRDKDVKKGNINGKNKGIKKSDNNIEKQK